MNQLSSNIGGVDLTIYTGNRMPPVFSDPLRSLGPNPDPSPGVLADHALGMGPVSMMLSQPETPSCPGMTPSRHTSSQPTTGSSSGDDSGQGANFPGMYSSTGFDMFTILSKVANRANAQVNIGPVDMSCSFLVVDALKYDMPIVYASYSFEILTGYKGTEIIGRNCRFLQAPDGHVTVGSRRRYTDNSTVFQLKRGVTQVQDVQVSLINYKKGGQPFINLVTVVPISLEGNSVTHFVGFQVDLVEQPNAILEKMKDGSYIVNYSQLSLPPYLSPGFMDRPIDHLLRDTVASERPFPAMDEVFEMIGGQSDPDAVVRRWNQMLLQHADDFIHVLSLKGVFLYCSTSIKRLLEYEPEELIGQNLSKVCHPSDLVPVLRELKDVPAQAMSNGPGTVAMVYRVRRKNSGYCWLEVHGRLHADTGKGRKCVVLSGRFRPMYQLSREAFHACGGAKENEFWGKLSLDGLYLYATSACQDILGYDASEIMGTSMYQLIRANRTTALTRSLQQVSDGTTVRLRHSIQSKGGQQVEVVTTFYPGNATEVQRAQFIIFQSQAVRSDDEPPELSSTSSSAPSPQTNQLASDTDNLFSLVDPTRSTAWQYEIHQLRMVNKRLRDELELLAMAKTDKKKKKSTKRMLAALQAPIEPAMDASRLWHAASVQCSGEMDSDPARSEGSNTDTAIDI
ncbi:hypothetical protein H4R34_005150 [Dimargaris verticillata]|uniref:White collar 1 protein n=1 Tax=Dimargaris verticillata TaxID=2761393 RepID=A0A9W8AXJ9_9FUNG|nr:hypothetical protein H4R34_005150 [Dimargaris verticillata]